MRPIASLLGPAAAALLLASCAAMMTAQLDGEGHPFGMNVPGNENRRLALNILHWLTRLS